MKNTEKKNTPESQLDWLEQINAVIGTLSGLEKHKHAYNIVVPKKHRKDIHYKIREKAKELGCFMGKFSAEKWVDKKYIHFAPNIISATNNKETYDFWNGVKISWKRFLEIDA